MNNVGWTYQVGNTVCYTERHYEWLKLVARWPSPYVARTALKGTVVEVTATTVAVRWNGSSDPVVHLPGNLDLVKSDDT